LVVAAAAGAPASVLAQDSNRLTRAFQFFGPGAHIGVSIEDLSDADAKQLKGGVRVETVTPGGPADKAGIKAGDTITEFDGDRVRSTQQFSRLVRETPVGRQVAVTLSRNGQRMNVTVTPDSGSFSDDFGVHRLDIPRAARIPTPMPPLPPSTPRPRALAPEAFGFQGLLRLSGRRLGVTIESIDDQLAEYFGVKEGVLVKSVLDGSAAQKAGIKAGDVITGVNGSKVYDAGDLNRLIDRVDANGEFTAEIVREKKTQSLKGKLETPDTRPRTRTRTIL
jgi:serine protease Do